MEPIINPEQSALSGRLLMIMAARVSESLTIFSSWLIASFAAVLALIIANIETVSKFLPPAKVGGSASIFLIAVGLHVFQRYLAAITAGSAAVSKEVGDLKLPETLDMNRLMDDMEKSTMWPGRFFVRRAFNKIRAGDLAAAGRMQGLMAQWQGVLVLAQMGLVLWAAYTLARAL